MKIENFEKVEELMGNLTKLKRELEQLLEAYDKRKTIIRVQTTANYDLIQYADNHDYNNENINSFPHNINYASQIFFNAVTDAYEAEIKNVTNQIQEL